MKKETVKIEIEFPMAFVEALEKLVAAKGYWCRGVPEFCEEAVRLHYRSYVKAMLKTWTLMGTSE